MNPIVYVLLSGVMTLGATPKNELPEQVKTILEKPDSVEIYSLDTPEGDEKAEMFRDRKVLGKVTVKDEKVRQSILDEVVKCIPPAAELPKDDFTLPPWHGLRVTQGKKEVDLLFNFHRNWMTAQIGEETVAKVTITNEVRVTLDKLFSEAKISIAKGRREEEKAPNSRALLEKAELVELYSLEPLEDKGEKGERFHGYKVLGKVAIKEEKVRKNLVGQITPALVPEVYNKLLLSLCFHPRHAFRMQYQGESIDILICFECTQFKVIPGGSGKQFFKLAEKEGWELIDFTYALYESKAQEALDKVLRDANVPLAKKRKTD